MSLNKATQIMSRFSKIPELYLYAENEELRNLYTEKALEHNKNVTNNYYADSGFDLFAPTEMKVEGTFMYNYQIKCAMFDKDFVPQAYYLYPRSSIYKSGLRLANSVGIIDRGYRGNICAVFDTVVSKGIEKNQRLTQICHPNLEPFLVHVVDSMEPLGDTSRGQDGFGSTGI